MFWMKVCKTIASNFLNFLAGSAVAAALSAVARDRIEPASTDAAVSSEPGVSTEKAPAAAPARLVSAARAASISIGSAARATSITMSLGGEIAKKVRLLPGFLSQTMPQQACGRLARG